jgi:hypothetical protein
MEIRDVLTRCAQTIENCREIGRLPEIHRWFFDPLDVFRIDWHKSLAKSFHGV